MTQWIGTTVPNTGYVETIYFNINLSVEEVVNELEKLTYVLTPFLSHPVSPLLFSENGSPVIFAVKGEYGGGIFYEINYSTDIINQVYEKVFSDSVGWKKDLCIINSSVIDIFSEIPVGTENDKISSLFSITQFEKVEENETIIKKYKVGYIDSGKGGGIQFDIPSPTNLKIEEGILSFDPVDVSEYTEFNPYLTYIINVNGGTDIETSNTTFNLSSVLNNGENVIEVKAKVMFGFNTNSDINNLHIQYTKPERYLYQLDAVFSPYASSNDYIYSFKINEKVLVSSRNGFKIFDPTTKQMSSSFRNCDKLAADEYDAYYFGINTIYKYDKTTEDFDTTRAGIGYISDIFTNGANFSVNNVCIGNIIYFICNDDSGLYITEFNTSTLTAEKTVTISNNKWSYYPNAVICSGKIYLLGGVLEISEDKVYTYNHEIITYDPNTKIITKIQDSFPVRFYYESGTAVSVENYIYVLDGMVLNENNNLTYNKSIYRFDTLTNQVTVLGTPTLPYTTIHCASAISIDGIIYWFGASSHKTLEIKL